ncbi:MAG: HD domain-containing protein [Parasporobacterium sp.]|nr:HD domain-containing protein [Parasporobacterium sp.]
MITYETLRQNDAISTYIIKADESLAALGFTEHSFPHVCKVAQTAEYILNATGARPRQVELARIAAYLHDIGNLINRTDHSQSGAVMAFRILDKMGMDPEEMATVVTAIGNHDEGTGVPVNTVAAALIIADKSDVRRSRVRNRNIAAFDIHDRVNYSVEKSTLNVDSSRKLLVLELTVDTEFSPVMDFFEIFLNRMRMCRQAAETLGLTFRLVINGQQMV